MVNINNDGVNSIIMSVSSSCVACTTRGVVPNADISLQSGPFWATFIASSKERLLDLRSCWIVFIHVERGRPGGLLQFTKGELLWSYVTAQQQISGRCRKCSRVFFAEKKFLTEVHWQQSFDEKLETVLTVKRKCMPSQNARLVPSGQHDEYSPCCVLGCRDWQQCRHAECQGPCNRHITLVG